MPDLTLHKTRIGGSGAAAIFGLHQWLTAFALWYSMKVRQGPEDPMDIRMVIGKMLERSLPGIYSYMTGREVEYFDKSVADPTRPYMMATPDAFCVNERRGVEFKVVQWDQSRKYGENANEIPARVIIQADWYMAAFDYDLWDVCAYVGTGAPRIYTLHRDRETERAMLARVEEWHTRYILGDERPPLDNSYEAQRWLQEVYPMHKRPDMRDATPEEALLLDDYVALRVAQKAMKVRQAEMETALKAAVADREGIEFDEGRFTWRRTKDSQWIDWQSLANGLLYGFIADQQKRDEKLAEYTHPKPGYRKIRIDHPALRAIAAAEEEVPA
jgi:predicted phage-related endonuclease